MESLTDEASGMGMSNMALSKEFEGGPTEMSET
jgi:hypothetical protein